MKKRPEGPPEGEKPATGQPDEAPRLTVSIPLDEIDNYIMAFLTSDLKARLAVEYANQLKEGKAALLIRGGQQNDTKTD